jgi:hypothetical protein
MIYHFWENWLLYHKCIFDGENKLIYVTPGESTINVKTDLYSDWKEWVQVDQNSKFEPALRTIGGDPLGETQYAGDMYFLINGWQVVIDHYVEVNGILYSDDFPSPYIIQPGGGVFATVSSLALAYNTTGAAVPTVEDIRVEMDNNSTKLTSIDAKVQTLTVSPTAEDIAAEVRVELTPELAHILTLENNSGLTPTQATMLLELYNIMGLDPTKPLVVTNTSRTVQGIIQTIDTTPNSTTVQRQ